MFHSLLSVVTCLIFASQVVALQLMLPAPIGNITASQVLSVPDGPYTAPCTDRCGAASSAITACGDNDTCLCTQDLVTQLTACEQCMYEEVVRRNIKVPDLRVGSNAVLAAYAGACKAPPINATVAAALTLPPFWDGSINVKLNTPATVVVVGFGGILGGSAIWLLSNM